MKKIKTAILTGYGINADQELGYAFEKAGSEVHYLHVNDVINQPAQIMEYSILGFPGGFSFGDHLGSGKVLSHILKKNLGTFLEQFLANQKNLVLGICNGFQTITKMGLVPNMNGKLEPEASLINNQSGNFIDRWVTLRCNSANASPWLEGIQSMRVPIRHGEGCFIMPDDKSSAELLKRNLPAFYYAGENPNGAYFNIAGITDVSGRVLGMMPHPEAFIYADQDPQFNKVDRPGAVVTDGQRLFLNAVNYCQNRI